MQNAKNAKCSQIKCLCYTIYIFVPIYLLFLIFVFIIFTTKVMLYFLLQSKHQNRTMAKYVERSNAVDNSYTGPTWNDEECTFPWVKETLEADYPGKKIIFCKEQVRGIEDDFDRIPNGYHHTFLIRKPVKSYLSLRKLWTNQLPPGVSSDTFQLDKTLEKLQHKSSDKPYLCDYEVILKFMKYLDGRGEDCIGGPIRTVIDADDLQNHPESILRQYCDAVGIPYNDRLLQWESGDEIVKKNWFVSRAIMQGNQFGGYYRHAFESTHFLSVKDAGSSSTDALPPDVVRLCEKAEPYYKQLYEMRLRPNAE